MAEIRSNSTPADDSCEAASHPASDSPIQFPIKKNDVLQIIKFVERYKPATKKAKADSLKKAAAASEQSLAPSAVAAPKALEYGVKDVTALVESKRAALVIIAHDGDPIEIVIWLPALCRKFEVPYLIVKGKARLGQVVGLAATSCIAIGDVKEEDKKELQRILDSVSSNFTNLCQDLLHKWGGGELSDETKAKLQAQGKTPE
jgi:large subunit ribosomal protein L7Ae